MALRFPAAALLAAALVCVPSPSMTAGVQRASAVPADPDERAIHHVLNRLGFGARPGDVEKVRAMGLAAYIEQQLAPETMADVALEKRLAGFTTLSMSSRELAGQFFVPARQAIRQQQRQPQTSQSANSMTEPSAQPAPSRDVMAARRNAQRALGELTQARLLRAVFSERQLNEVIVDFWFNHFNVFAGKGAVRAYLTEYERDVIRPHVFGRFRDLLGAVAHSPAMLFYLDNWQSSAPNAPPAIPPRLADRLNDPRVPARQREQLRQRLEQMQAQRPRQSRGLNENYGRELMELHTLGVDGGYTQEDVIAVARAFTGWTIDGPRQGGGFVFRPAMHDTGEKAILGERVPAGGGEEEGERVLDLLARHPSTARHIAFKLAQRFVADEPPASLVDRAASVFLETDGDLREVVRTIVTSPEFFAPAAYRAKVKTPLDFVVSAARISNASMVSAQPLAQALRADLGMPLYGCQPPTGYSDTADAWVNTGALLNRMNLALRLVNSEARGVRVPVATIVPDASPASRERLAGHVLGGDVSEATAGAFARAETPQQLLALALGSPEFQRK
jgi:uncharacterized protein (DUF1800 family)